MSILDVMASRGAVGGPQGLLPSQIAPGAAQPGVPERRLMAAVLEDAVRVYEGRCREGIYDESFAEVEAWFAADDWAWPFSFVRLCDALGLDAGYLRRGLVRVPRAARREQRHKRRWPTLIARRLRRQRVTRTRAVRAW